MDEIKTIREEIENTSIDYSCVIDMIKFALYTLVSEHLIKQDTYDLLGSKFDIIDRKFRIVEQIANTSLTKIAKELYNQEF